MPGVSQPGCLVSTLGEEGWVSEGCEQGPQRPRFCPCSTADNLCGFGLGSMAHFPICKMGITALCFFTGVLGGEIHKDSSSRGGEGGKWGPAGTIPAPEP